MTGGMSKIREDYLVPSLRLLNVPEARMINSMPQSSILGYWKEGERSLSELQMDVEAVRMQQHSRGMPPQQSNDDVSLDVSNPLLSMMTCSAARCPELHLLPMTSPF